METDQFLLMDNVTTNFERADKALLRSYRCDFARAYVEPGSLDALASQTTNETKL
jgi:hypothetical protein